jgi:hypothetical protein
MPNLTNIPPDAAEARLGGAGREDAQATMKRFLQHAAPAGLLYLAENDGVSVTIDAAPLLERADAWDGTCLRLGAGLRVKVDIEDGEDVAAKLKEELFLFGGNEAHFPIAPEAALLVGSSGHRVLRQVDPQDSKELTYGGKDGRAFTGYQVLVVRLEDELLLDGGNWQAD